ncbi:MAG: HDOD domain-containing protein, partial [Desulfonatronovibrionaceae bacterium]
ALNVLGISELRKILILINMSSLASRVDKKIFNLNSYWEHHCSTGLIASKIALMCQYKDPSEAFTMGILHDLGKLMTAIFQPQAWQSIQKKAREQGCPDHEAENSYWGIDHAIAGAMVLRKWNLPESIIEAISWHHNPSGASEEYRTAASILSLANLMSHEIKGDQTLMAQELFTSLDIDPHEALQNAEAALKSPEYSGLKTMLNSF